MTLEDFFNENKKIALGFSGGVDSSYLLYAGIKYGADIRPYYIKTAFQPQFEFDDAIRFTKQLGIELSVITLDILSVPEVATNPVDRCYFCKRTLFQALKQRANEDGYFVLADGTNASDNTDERPGMRALYEQGIRSPLRECRLTKEKIRATMKAQKLSIWNKPAYACLATRILQGAPITKEMLLRIEGAENTLAAMGFSDFRVRVFHGVARLQVLEAEIQRVAACSTEIKNSLRPFFDTVLLDLTGR